MKPRPMLTLTTLLSTAALAHQPQFNPGSPTQAQAYPIPEPRISKVITAQGQPGTLGWYALTVQSGFTLDATLFVSARCPNTYQPRLWLVSADLPAPQSRPTFLPANQGAMNAGTTYAHYSGHGVTARKGQTLRRTLSAGTHYLVVEHGTGTGWAFISLGGLEVPGGTPAGREALARFGLCE